MTKVKIIGSIVLGLVILAISIWLGMQLMKYAAVAVLFTIIGAVLMYFFLNRKKEVVYGKNCSKNW